MPRKIVLFEANEIPYPILDDFIASHPESRLARELPRCRQYTTETADTGSLSPWITWPTLHRGVNNEVHGINSFGQDLTEVDTQYPPIWRILADAGISTGVFGPLHSWPLPADANLFDYYLPDTFARTPECYPDELTLFQEFNLAMARQSPRNVSGSIDVGTLASFLPRAPRLGVRMQTMMALAKQLLDERSQDWKRNRRRTYQPVLAFDLFMKQLKSHKPQFSNFFTNHVASAMHRYWAASYPEQYETMELSAEWRAQYGGEIDFAMDWFDDMFDRVATFTDRNPEYLLVVASSMGQAATSGRRIDSQLYLRDLEQFMRRAGLQDSEWERRPAMDPHVCISVRADKVAMLEKFLDALSIDGMPVKRAFRDQVFVELEFGHVNLEATTNSAMFGDEALPLVDLGFESVTIEDEAGSTAYHVSPGTFYVYDPADASPKSGRPSVSATLVAPALLGHFGIPLPEYMEKPSELQLV